MVRRKSGVHTSLFLTDDLVAALPFAMNGRGVYIVRDTDISGFRCIVNRNSKRLVFQGEVREGGKRRAIYKRLGDPRYVKTNEARARALEEMARLARVTDPDARAGTTFREAWDSYLLRLEKKGRSPRTIEDYRQKFTAHLEPSFGKVALRDIKRTEVTRLHDRLTTDAGPYAANGVCRVGHAIYRHAALGMEVPEMPALNPFRAYDLFNEEKPRQTGISEKELAAKDKGWFAQVLALDNPVMRELWVIIALTGLRRRDVTTMRWEHVNLKELYIEIPDPKGGEVRAFRCPITPQMVRSLKRVKAAGKALCDMERCNPWVFPSVASRSGHVEELKSKHLDRSAHALRHTFRAMCEGAKISKVHSRLLMNYKISKDVHDAYMTPGAMFDQLSKASEAVSAYIFKHLPKGAEHRLKRRCREQLKPSQIGTRSGADQRRTLYERSSMAV